jgi:DNA-binding NtrC family response regulator
MRQGAYDYLMKPFGVEQVEALLLRLNERQQLVRQVASLNEEVRDRHRSRNFLGGTPAMTDVFTTIERAARSNATVLVSGESGTGKELVARALHQQSPRAEGPFVKVNCAALTETLLASELFGHEKGSFTGADNQRIGRFELADGGTLLLDEISEISLELQAKLLRVLEEREFERVGGEKPIAVDVRVVATTNRDLPNEVAEGGFREDLYYRLNVIPVELPALRERRDDVPAILDHYLEAFGQEMACKPVLTDGGRQLLCDYRWPGNVRELVNVVERLVVLNGDAPMDEQAVRRCLPELKRVQADDAADAKPAAATGRTLEAMEREHVLAVWEESSHDKQSAADALGITPRALWARLKKYGAVD